MTRHRRNHLALTSLVAGTALVVLGQAGAGAVPVEGNPSCADVLPGSTEFKIDTNPASGTYNGPGGLVITIVNNGDSTFSWTSNQPIEAVIVKGGPNADVTVHPGGATAGSGATLVNPQNQQRYGISHVSFCDTPDQPTTTTTAPGETTTTAPPETTTTAPPASTTTVPGAEATTTTAAPELLPEVLPQVVTPQAEVLGVQQERGALPRTGSTTGLATAAGAALLAAGAALVRRSRTLR